MSARNTTPRDKQIPSWRKDSELRLRAQERLSGQPGSSFAAPFYVGDTEIGFDKQGGLIRMPVFEGEILRGRVGSPTTGTLPSNVTISSATDFTALATVTFNTYRDAAIIDIIATLGVNKNVALTDGNLFAVSAFWLDDVTMTGSGVSPSVSFGIGPTGYVPRALTFYPASTNISVPATGQHTITWGARKANLGAADAYVVTADESALNVVVYEVIG